MPNLCCRACFLSSSNSFQQIKQNHTCLIEKKNSQWKILTSSTPLRIKLLNRRANHPSFVTQAFQCHPQPTAPAGASPGSASSPSWGVTPVPISVSDSEWVKHKSDFKFIFFLMWANFHISPTCVFLCKIKQQKSLNFTSSFEQAQSWWNKWEHPCMKNHLKSRWVVYKNK